MNPISREEIEEIINSSTMESDELFPFPTQPRWSDSIPPPVQKRMVHAVESQLDKLPLHLEFEWRKPCYIERSFFVEAAKHIIIPHPEYWQDFDSLEQ